MWAIASIWLNVDRDYYPPAQKFVFLWLGSFVDKYLF